MTYRVVFTPEAEDHLDEPYRYVASTAMPDIAAGYVDAIISYCEGFMPTDLQTGVMCPPTCALPAAVPISTRIRHRLSC